jgi:dihydroorotate dehydrogenase (fumarate)
MSEYTIGHLEVSSPWGNAGGVVKTPEEVELMAHTGVGWVEAGSYSLEPRTSQHQDGENLYRHSDTTGYTFNSLKLPNPGMDVAEKQIPQMRDIAHGLGKKLLINVVPVSSNPIPEAQELSQRAYEAGADGVVLNTGCPTVKEGKSEILSYDFRLFKSTVDELRTVAEDHQPIFVKISPQDSYSDMRRLLRLIDREIVSAIIAVNTWPVRFEPNDANNPILQISGGSAGKSGPATAKDAFKQTSWASSAASIGGRKLDIISATGIMTGEELGLRMSLGAVAGAGTTLYYESAEEGWSEATDRLLRQYAETSS